MVKSMKPGKQRKAHYNAPIHQKRKRVAARLQLAKPDARFAGVRTVTVRVGDVVQVTRGDQAHGGKRHGGKRHNEPPTGAVLRIDAEKGRLYIEGGKGQLRGMAKRFKWLLLISFNSCFQSILRYGGGPTHRVE